MNNQVPITLQSGDALIVVDVQNDFLPGGALAVGHGDEVIPVLNRYIERFSVKRLPILATRDWHPANHCSFKLQGGPWPPHCVAETAGADFARELRLPGNVIIVSKATQVEQDAYSGFVGTDLAQRLRALKVTRVFVGGLATDYCVLNTVLDALQNNFAAVLLTDAIRAVNVQPADGNRAIEKMVSAAAQIAQLKNIQ